MYQNLWALHVVDESHQASISVEDIYDLGKKMDSNSEKVYEMGQKCLFKYATQQEALVYFYWHCTTTFMW